jgi:hypothetical protein
MALSSMLARAELPPTPAMPAVNHHSIAPAVVAVNWVFALLAIIVVAARHYVRRNIIHRFGIDDYLIFVTLALGLTMSSLLSVAAHFGLGRHVQALMMGPNGPSNLLFTLKYTLIAEFFILMTPCIGRISYAFLLLSIIPPVRWQKYFLWTIIILEIAVDFVTATVSLAQCTPMSSFWEGKRQNCLPPTVQRDIGFFQGSLASLVDLTLAVFPATLFWNLQLKLSLKISLSILMGLGVFAMICSIIKTVHLQNLTHLTDPTFDLAILAIWCSIEAYVVLLAASIPTLRPLMGRKPEVSTRGYQGYGSSNKAASNGYKLSDSYKMSDSKYINGSHSSESQTKLHSVITTNFSGSPTK